MTSVPPTRQWTFTADPDNRLIARMRLILVSIGLVSISLDPSEPDHYAPVIYAVLSLYAVYAAVLYALASHPALRVQRLHAWAHWADCGWFIALIALSHGTSSIFYYFVFLSILVASFRWGFISGLRLTIVATILFSAIGVATAPTGPDFELNRFVIRSAQLLVLGYLIASWGGHDILLKRRLALLKEAATLSNPRFGVDRTISAVIDRLHAFHDADACLLIVHNPETAAHELRLASRRRTAEMSTLEPVVPAVARMLLAFPPDQAVVYCSASGRWWDFGVRYAAYDAKSKERAANGRDAAETVAARLDCASFLSVPVYSHHRAVGRLYLTASPRAMSRAVFTTSDADFLLQLIDHVMPVIDNIRLVDRLASNAAEEERQKLARNIHDSVIQPYLGLQMGLAAVRNRLEGRGDTTGDIDRLLELTDVGIGDLRRYVQGLKDGSGPERNLLPAVRGFAAKFTAATGIDVSVTAEGDVCINDRLAAEAFQMIVEGLSNVRRHSHASSATVRLCCPDGALMLQIENDGAPDSTPSSFTPRSISARAAALGGWTSVEPRHGGGTLVAIAIPL